MTEAKAHELLDGLVTALEHASPAELDRARALCEEFAHDYGVRAARRATWKRLATLLREEMGPNPF
jgi:hypothetical protein